MGFIKVRDDYFNYGLDYGEILLLSIISSLSNTDDGCYANNKYFADKFNCDERTIQRWIKKLKEKNLIQVKRGANGTRYIKTTRMSPTNDTDVTHNR